MKNYFVFGKINSKDYALYAANKNQFEGGSKRIETIKIPGRNGTLSISDETFDNIPITYKMYGKYDSTELKRNIAGIRAALGSTSGYLRLADSFEPDIFMKARYSDPFSVKSSDRKNAATDITFDCDPRKFLKGGEEIKIYTASGQLRNPTRFDALPLIRAYGTGTLTISGVAVTISTASEYTDIDCEIQEAYKGSANCNNNITLTGGKFPSLVPGTNNIYLSGLSRIEITPRYWTR